MNAAEGGRQNAVSIGNNDVILRSEGERGSKKGLKIAVILKVCPLTQNKNRILILSRSKFKKPKNVYMLSIGCKL